MSEQGIRCKIHSHIILISAVLSPLVDTTDLPQVEEEHKSHGFYSTVTTFTKDVPFLKLYYRVLINPSILLTLNFGCVNVYL